MIPFQILACDIMLRDMQSKTQADSKQMEVRALELWDTGFTFRLCGVLKQEEIETIQVHFFQYAAYQFQTLALEHYTLTVEEETVYFTVYRLCVQDAAFRPFAIEAQKEYLHYIHLKLEEEDAVVSEELVGYPAEKETEFPEDFTQWKQHWFGEPAARVTGAEPEGSRWRSVDIPMWIALQEERLWDMFLAMEWKAYTTWYWKEHLLQWHPAAKQTISGIVIGNAFCGHMFPERKKFWQLIEKAKEEQLQVMLSFAPVKEDMLEYWKEFFAELEQKIEGSFLELEVNDWGMLHLIKNQTGLLQNKKVHLVLGRLLGKRRKDVRMKYKQGIAAQQGLLAENAILASWYQKDLQQRFGIEGYAAETCGYISKIPQGSSLFLPYYQTNTAAHCMVQAIQDRHSRGRWSTGEDSCTKCCQESCFLYPEHLPMIGKYNSLFGLDEAAVTDAAYLQNYLEQKPRHLIWNLM